MSTKAAKDFARKGRKLAPANFYDFARNLEKAIGALVDEIEVLKQGDRQEPAKPAKVRDRATW